MKNFTSYVEYLAFKLKEFGSSGDEFYRMLNECAEKIGFTVEEAIVKEHMEITKTTDFMSRAITGLKHLAEDTNLSAEAREKFVRGVRRYVDAKHPMGVIVYGKLTPEIQTILGREDIPYICFRHGQSIRQERWINGKRRAE